MTTAPAAPASAAPVPGRVTGAVIAVLVVTLARALTLPLNQTDLYVDEAQYWFWSLHPALGYYSKPPGIAWVIAATTAIFGHAEWAVRLGSPLLHGVTSLVLIALGRRLYGDRAGALAGIVYAILPAVAYSAGVVSTDVPLLACWSVALLLYLRLLAGGGWGTAVGLGLAIGLGLNTKYAMAFFIGVSLLHLALDPANRRMLASPKLWLAFGLGLASLVPNAIWQSGHGFATLNHTADNANWRGGIHLGEMAEFVGAQFGVFGPLTLLVLLAAGVGLLRTRDRAADRLLLCFSLPILGVFVAQALISEANANWAATAYPAAAVLVAAVLAEPGRKPLALAALGINAAASVIIFILPLVATHLPATRQAELFTRVLGWRQYADALRPVIASNGIRTLIVERRSDAAGLLYYLRDLDIALVTVPPAGRPRDHFQMSYPWTPSAPQPALVVRPPAGLPAGMPITAAAGPVKLEVSRGVVKSGVMFATPVRW